MSVFRLVVLSGAVLNGVALNIAVLNSVALKVITLSDVIWVANVLGVAVIPAFKSLSALPVTGLSV